MKAALARRMLRVLLAEVVVLAVFGGIILATVNRPFPPALGAAILVLGAASFAAPIVISTQAIAPRWAARVQAEGQAAEAEVLAFDPGMGTWGYEGPDFWLQVPVRVHAPGAAPFEARMHCRLSQTLALRPGARVPVRYDPANRRRVVMPPGQHWGV